MSKLKQLLFSLNENDRKIIEEKLKEKDQKIYQLKQQNEELMLQLSKYEIEKHKPAYCTLAGTECEYLGNVHELKQQLAEKDKEINSLIVDYEKRISQEQKLMSNMEHLLTEKQNAIDEINKEFVQAVYDWKALCAEKDKEIEDLKEWQDWYSMWHKKFQKQIEDLTTELETYRPTKLHGNGQCKCFNCNAINWTDWCSQYKGHTYCDDCLKEVLKEEQTPQTQLAIQELEKLKASADKWFEFWENSEYEGNRYDKLDVSNAYLQMSCEIEQQIKLLKGE